MTPKRIALSSKIFRFHRKCCSSFSWFDFRHSQCRSGDGKATKSRTPLLCTDRSIQYWTWFVITTQSSTRTRTCGKTNFLLDSSSLSVSKYGNQASMKSGYRQWSRERTENSPRRSLTVTHPQMRYKRCATNYYSSQGGSQMSLIHPTHYAGSDGRMSSPKAYKRLNS